MITRRFTRAALCLLALVSALYSAAAADRLVGNPVAWGFWEFSILDIPPEATNLVAIAAADDYSLGLREDGTVLAWGNGTHGQTVLPGDLTNIVQISASYSYALALRADGTVVGWGGWGFVPTPHIVPEGLSNVVAVSAGAEHGAALLADGTVRAWGDDSWGQSSVPADLRNVTAVAAGQTFSLALKADGTIVSWGTYPAPAGLSNVAKIATGIFGNNFVISSNGTLVAWKSPTADNSFGQATVPPGISNVIDIAIGGEHNLVIKQDHTVTAWGRNNRNQAQVPAGLSGVFAAAGGRRHSLVLRGLPIIDEPPVSLTVNAGSNHTFQVGARLNPPFTYQWLHQGIPLAGATNSSLVLTNIQTGAAGEYRVRVSNRLGSTESPAATLGVLTNQLDVALNRPGALFYTGGASEWSVATDGHDGFSAAASGRVSDNGGTWLETRLDGPGLLTFWWRVSCEEDFDGLEFLVDGAVRRRLSGESGWIQESFPLAPGPHLVRWLYQKDSSRAGGADGAWLDEVLLTAGGEAAFLPRFTVQPVGTTAVAGKPAVLQAQVEGIGPMYFQWFKQDLVLEGATNPVLKFAPIAPADQGAYQVVVSNLYGSLKSDVATLQVANPPTASGPPASLRTVRAGETVEWTPPISGDSPMVYQWRKDNADLPGETNPVLRLEEVPLSASGSYSVAASNPLGALVADAGSLTVVPRGMAVGWGGGTFNPTGIVARLTNVIEVAATSTRGIVLTADGRVYSTAAAGPGQASDNPTLTNIAAISASWWEFIGLRRDGVVVDSRGVSAGFSNVQAISAGAIHNMGLQSNGTVVCWGLNSSGQCNVPANLAGIKAVAGGARHSLALGSNGVVYGWGDNASGESDPPPGLSDVQAIAAGLSYSMALRSNGTLVAWGLTPPGMPSGLSNLVGIAAGSTHSVALRADGSIVSWGNNSAGQVDRTPRRGFATQIAACDYVNMALMPGPLIQGEPKDQEVELGASLQLSVSARGEAPLAYQWRLNGTNLNGATLPDLLLSNVTLAHEGYYSTRITDRNGLTEETFPARITVRSRPTFSPPPSNQQVLLGGQAMFVTTASAVEPLRLQWLKDGAVLHEETNSTLIVGATNCSQAGLYALVATGDHGSITSAPALLTVLAPPRILQQPESILAQVGDAIEWSVQADCGPAPQYQWFFGNSPLIAATNSRLSLAQVQLEQSGSYSVVLSNAYGVVTSTPALLTVWSNRLSEAVDLTESTWHSGPQPRWSFQTNVTHDGVDAAASGIIGDATNVVMETTVTGPGTLSFWWKVSSEFFSDGLRFALDGQTVAEISGERDWSQVTIPLGSGPQNLSWRFFKDAWGKAGADQGWLDEVRWIPGPSIRITEHPVDQHVALGEAATFRVVSEGPAGATHQWSFNGREIPNATNRNFKIDAVRPEHVGQYSAAVKLAGQTVMSNPARLSVRNLLVVASPPSQTVPPGAKVLLAPTITGDPPIRYQWMVNGTNLPGATNQTLLLSPIEPSASGRYSITASNALGGVQSATADLEVRPRGMVVLWGGSGPLTDSLAARETNIVGLAAGNGFVLGIRSDGTVVGWEGMTNPPASLRQVTAAAAGSEFAVALRQDGSLQGWGTNSAAALNFPPGLTNVAALAAGAKHVVALNRDGTVVSWGGGPVVPPGLSNAVAVATGTEVSAAVRTDGTVVSWGSYGTGAISNAQAVAAGDRRGVVLLRDGSIAEWGNFTARPPSLPPITNAVAVAAWGRRTLALLSNRTVQAWGQDSLSLTSVPPDLRDVVAIGAGSAHNAFLKSRDYEPELTEYPQSQIARVGDTVTFRSQARGATPVFHQWSLNGVPIEGATNATLVLPAVSPAQAGDYGILVTNLSGAPNAASAELLLADGPPRISGHPADGTVFRGSNFTFRVGVRSVAPVGYRWLLSGTNLPGATAPALTITNASLAAAGDYRVAVSNAYGIVTSTVARLTVDSPPVILTTLSNQNVLVGSNAVFEILVAGTEPLSYQWRLNGQPLPGANSRILTLSPAGFSASGHYSVLASNRYGTALSSTGRLDVLPLAPTILSQPSSRVAPVGSSVALSVTAAGAPSLVFQWVRNGSPLPGATQSSLTIPDLGLDNEGEYQAVISNSFGSATSSVARVAVLVPPNVVVWGLSNSPALRVPLDLTNAVQIASGHSFLAAVRADGTVTAWGDNTRGQTNVPPGLNNVVALSAGDEHVVALRGDGRVVAWGANDYGQIEVPPGLADVASIACGSLHSLVVLSNGTVVGWGFNHAGQSAPPTDLRDVVAVATGFDHSAALRRDGTIVDWGAFYGDTRAFRNLRALAGKSYSFAALQSNGTILDWRSGSYGGTNLAGPTNVIALAMGHAPPNLQPHGLALGANGQVSGWGDNSAGQLNAPARATNVISIAAGWRYSAAAVTAVQFVQQPRPYQAIEGQPATFEARAVGRGPVTYQWHQNGAPLPGATNPILVLPSVLYADRGSYSVIASDGGPAISSRSATLSVIPLVPEITGQPAATTSLTPGGSITLQVTAAGLGVLRYQWWHNGQPMALQTNASLQVSSVQDADAGAYSVVVLNDHGARRSSNAVLKIVVPNLIVDNEFAEIGGVWTTNVSPSQYGTSFLQKPRGDGSSYVRFTPNLPRQGTYGVYEWHPAALGGSGVAPGLLFQGASTELYYIIQPFRGGTWNLVVSRQLPAGSIAYFEIRDNVTPTNSFVVADAILFSYQPTEPRILSQPGNQVALIGQPTTLQVLAEGVPPLRYAWEFNGEPIPGATNTSLLLPVVNRTHAGTYRAMVISPDGVVFSQPALLRVALPPFSATTVNGALRIDLPPLHFLQSSTNVEGPYRDVPATTNTVLLPLTNRQEFFRLRQ